MTIDKTERLTAMKCSEILLFPIARRTGDISRCAEELDRHQGEAAIRYWKSECRLLADELLSAGFDENHVREEVLKFQDEVQQELLRRHQARALQQSRTGRARKQVLASNES